MKIFKAQDFGVCEWPRRMGYGRMAANVANEKVHILLLYAFLIGFHVGALALFLTLSYRRF